MEEEQEIINHQIVNAVYNIDAERFFELVSKHEFDPELLEDIHFANGVPCPIHWITQCWEIALGDAEDWKQDYRETISERIEQNLKIKRFFEEYLHVQFKPIDFYNTDFWFFRAERDDDFDTFFAEPIEYMLNHYRTMDLNLFMSVHKFDFEETELLLESGANPTLMIDEEAHSCIDLIETECSYLEIELNSIIFGIRTVSIYQNCTYLIDLLGLAANTRMYNLLSKYAT